MLRTITNLSNRYANPNDNVWLINLDFLFVPLKARLSKTKDEFTVRYTGRNGVVKRSNFLRGARVQETRVWVLQELVSRSDGLDSHCRFAFPESPLQAR